MGAEADSYLRAVPGGIRLAVSVQPRSSRTGFGELLGDRRKLAAAAEAAVGRALEEMRGPVVVQAS